MRGYVGSIQRGCVDDGPGVRTAVFLLGCPLRCPWCHNPEYRPYTPALLREAVRCGRCGACAAACPRGAASALGIRRELCVCCGACVPVCPSGALSLSGKSMEAREVLAVVERDAGHYRATGGGLTLSGGEPLAQPLFARELLAIARDKGIHTCVESSGVPAERVSALLGLVDVWLLDVKADEERHEELTGAPLAAVLQTLRALLDAGERVRLRCPLVPGVNDTPALRALLHKLAAPPGVEGVDILPYHRAGMGKYERMGLAYRLADVSPPGPDTLALWEAGR